MVFKFLKNASDNFFCNILGLDIDDCKTKSFKNFYCAKVSIYQNDIEYDAVFLFKKDTIKLIGQHLLFEDNLDQEASIDLLKEVANLIGGTAKTMIEEFDSDSIYTLSTPEYLGFIKNIKEMNLTCYTSNKINNRCFIVGLEEV